MTLRQHDNREEATRCSEVCVVGAQQVRCQRAGDKRGTPHYAHQWTALLDGGGRVEVHWRTKPEARELRDANSGHGEPQEAAEA